MRSPIFFAQANALHGKPSISAILALAGSVRFPTRFVREAMSNYSLFPTNNISNTKEHSRRIYLNRKEYAALLGLKQGNLVLGMTQTEAISTFYHEAAHAWTLNQLAKGMSGMLFRSLYSSSLKYYKKNGKLEGGLKIRSYERVVEEAISTYIGVRTKAWWNALSDLLNEFKYLETTYEKTIAHDEKDKHQKKVILEITEQAVRNLEFYKFAYSDSVSRENFGYDKIDGEQISITTKLFPGIRDFCDLYLLELRVPDTLPSYPHRLIIGEARSLVDDILTRAQLRSCYALAY